MVKDRPLVGAQYNNNYCTNKITIVKIFKNKAQLGGLKAKIKPTVYQSVCLETKTKV